MGQCPAGHSTTATSGPGERDMSIELQFTDDELAQLHLLLAQELESSRVELHHTAGRPYREYIKRRLDQGEALLHKLESALPSLRVAREN
jgi:hypothetical protein